MMSPLKGIKKSGEVACEGLQTSSTVPKVVFLFVLRMFFQVHFCRSFRSTLTPSHSPCPSLAFLSSELTSLRRLLELAFLTYISSLLPAGLPPELISKIFQHSQRAPKPFSLPPLTSSGSARLCESLQREKLVTLLDLLITSLPRLPRPYAPSLPALHAVIRALVQVYFGTLQPFSHVCVLLQDVAAWRPLLEQGISKISTSVIISSESEADVKSKHKSAHLLFSSFSPLPCPSPRRSSNSVSCYLSRSLLNEDIVKIIT